MKKLISIAAIILECALFTACNTATAENSGKSRFEGLECVKNHTAEYVDFVDTFEDLESISELIVEGEFIDDSEIVYEEYSYNYSIQKDLLVQVVSSCPMKITKVYSGDAKAGDIINVLQEEEIHNDRFIAHTMLTPMQKGDKWVFCPGHSRSENYDGYWCVADHKGRYPSKNSAAVSLLRSSLRSSLRRDTAFHHQKHSSLHNLHRLLLDISENFFVFCAVYLTGGGS